ncbi:helix-turn-helix transcriptional regulator [Ruficoccus sp. ZRK36]|uniref:helix-turn-helix domain-containing protein n=1 Tax=Ruficoccus sp. ZRK36 TaxID=2866311 RepID=UPI001C732C34|nr:helix-turn-helix transcriptional regulator [Ruficoccus sp. ZRK36]QYY34503.1 helix-turn-helix transcriptional regulator [Ruficoccus sp. ZRK36]
MPPITKEFLNQWIADKGMTQVEFGELVGWDKYAIHGVLSGKRKIKAPEQRLLNLLIFGKLPHGYAKADTTLEFSNNE